MEEVQSSAIPIRKFILWRDLVFGLESVIRDKKKDLEKAAEVLIDQVYMLKTMQKGKDSLLK